MPSRLRQTSSRHDETTKIYDIPGLQFNEPLTWKAGKAIPVADLLSRLQKLGGELRNFDQDDFESRQFEPLANDLANANLLGHKDKGIRAWTVACIVDVLKLCAPDAPFKGTQLRDIFTVIINSTLPALADPSNAYNSEHIYILHSLATSESIVLLADVTNHETLVSNLFGSCFDIVSGSAKTSSDQEVSTSVEYHLKLLLCALVNELDLPQDVTDIIISQFFRADPRNQQDQNGKGRRAESVDVKQGNLLLKDYPRAYNMAKSICTTCSEKLTAQVTQYFGTIIMDATASLQNQEDLKQSNRRNSDLNDSDDEDESLADLRKAHRLLRELWRACPDLLINVIPQIEAELSADSTSLRQLATETLGDIAAGIGIAGLAPSQPMDPAIYPLPSIAQTDTIPTTSNPMLIPASPKPFSTVHASAFQNFLGRRNDKSSTVRASWATAVGRILLTSGGGIGLNETEQRELLSGLAQMLRDSEERGRVSAVKSVNAFTYQGVVNILGADGGISVPGTVLSTLSERVTDRKHNVREQAIELLARIWGCGSKDIENTSELVISTLGDIPNRLMNAYYTNDPHIHSLLDKALFEYLVPIYFPPNKGQSSHADEPMQNGRRNRSSLQNGTTLDPDGIRVRRILTLIRSLDSRSRLVFFAMQKRQAQMANGVTLYLKACEEFNGGVIDDDSEEEKIKSRLTGYIDAISKTFVDSSRTSADLWKFAKLHNRRDYQLIRFAIGPEHDYRTMIKAIKELTKRIREGPTNTQSLLDTLIPLLYRCALIIYNRSHVPAIMQISKTDENGLAEAAHEVLKEISARNPEVLKSHIQSLCKELEENAPSATKFEDSGSIDTLKACSAFAKRYPAEVTKDRKFLVAMTNFALFSKSPRAAKHAVSIIWAVADKKEFYAKEILSKSLKDCQRSSPNFLSRLAAISQLCLLAPAAASAEADAILRIALPEILHQNHSPSTEKDLNAWMPVPDDESVAKESALRIVVNRCRSENDVENKQDFESTANHVLDILMRLLNEDGEITPTKDTPPAQRNYLRFVAAKMVLKLCSHKRRFEELLTPQMFNQIAMIVINPPNQVRSGFINQLKKYLGQNRLNHRWYTVLYLIAFEPDLGLKNSTLNWLKSRVQFFHRQQQAKTNDKKIHQNIMESTFPRLLSLLAHHPDYPEKTTEYYEAELLDFSKYIIFYLMAIATEDNLSLIFHLAQRVKQARDGIDGSESKNERLYLLSDLAQAVIRNYADMMPAHAKGINLLQTWPGTGTLSRSLFSSLPNHPTAQQIAEKNYLPEDVASGLEKVIKSYIRSTKDGNIGGNTQSTKKAIKQEKKRKSNIIDIDEDVDEDDKEVMSSKKSKKKSLPIRRTPQQKRKSDEMTPNSELPSRKSARVTNTKAKSVSYLEVDTEEEDDAEHTSKKKSNGADDEDDDGGEEEGEGTVSPSTSPLKEKAESIINQQVKNKGKGKGKINGNDNVVVAESEAEPVTTTTPNTRRSTRRKG